LAPHFPPGDCAYGGHSLPSIDDEPLIWEDTADPFDRIEPGSRHPRVHLFLGDNPLVISPIALPSLPIVVAVLFVGVGLLGMGNGAVFQLVPQRFADRKSGVLWQSYHIVA
jgi:hypothetical protein